MPVDVTDDCTSAADAVGRARAIRAKFRAMQGPAPAAPAAPPPPPRQSLRQQAIVRLLVEDHGFPLEAALATASEIAAIPLRAGRASVRDIRRLVCVAFHVTEDQLDESKREPDSAIARQLSMALSRHLTGKSFRVIAMLHGGRHRTTALFAHERFLKAMTATPLGTADPAEEWIEAMVPAATQMREELRRKNSEHMRSLRASGAMTRRPAAPASASPESRSGDGEANTNTVREIKALVCKAFAVTENEMDSPRRTMPTFIARQVSMALSRHLTVRSLPQIGALHHRDHTTVLYASKKLEAAIAKVGLALSIGAPPAAWVAAMVRPALEIAKQQRRRRSSHRLAEAA